MEIMQYIFFQDQNCCLLLSKNLISFLEKFKTYTIIFAEKTTHKSNRLILSYLVFVRVEKSSLKDNFHKIFYLKYFLAFALDRKKFEIGFLKHIEAIQKQLKRKGDRETGN